MQNRPTVDAQKQALQIQAHSKLGGADTDVDSEPSLWRSSDVSHSPKSADVHFLCSCTRGVKLQEAASADGGEERPHGLIRSINATTGVCCVV